MKHTIAVLLSLFLGVGATRVAARPKVVVNIIVSQLRYDCLERYEANLCEGGFKRFMREGAVCTQSRYGFMPTNTVAALATLTTGADPSTHGIIGERWIDYLTQRPVSLVDDHTCRGLECDAGKGGYSPLNLTVPTLGDALREDDSLSRVVSIALDPASAVVMGGFTRDVYWIDSTRCNWVSSTAYMNNLPEWVVKNNGIKVANQYLDYKWELVLPRYSYRNNEYSVIHMHEESHLRKVMASSWLQGSAKAPGREYAAIMLTPAANYIVKEFAKQAFIYEDLGRDNHPDIINVCFDASRWIGETYGSTSLEFEDMLYRLDLDIAELIDFLFAQRSKDDILIVLTSDHGAAEARERGKPRRTVFNPSQFKVIVNGYMNASFGDGEWVAGYAGRNLYLNHTQIARSGLSLADVQTRVAAFALQFSGITHVATSTAILSGGFASGWGEAVGNGFYPKRSGDLVINLAPGWVESEGGWMQTGSMYDYDTHVPLMLLGGGVRAGASVERDIRMCDVAPTLSGILGILRPVASTGRGVGELVEMVKK